MPGASLGSTDHEDPIQLMGRVGRYDMDLFPQKIGEGQFSKAYVCWSKEDSSQRYALKAPPPLSSWLFFNA